MKKINRLTNTKKKENKLEFFINESELFNFIQSNIDQNFNTFSSDSLNVINSPKYENVQLLKNNSLKLFINLNKINDIRRINQYLIEINKKIQENGILICNVETIEERRIRILKKCNYLSFTFFYPIDFFFKRIMPKIVVLKRLYFAISKGKNRVLSKCEALGRLYYCGFELINMKEINNRLYFIMKKIKEPVNDKNPSYHLIYKKRAIGKNGKIIYPYKFRTMHPYAEYLQDYITVKYGYSESGDGISKIKNDFRITSWGRFLRKHWLDELPQLLNVLNGEMKLVGVRPLSKRFLAEYPEDVREERLKHKPGCIPPYVAHIHHSLEEYIESDKKYLDYKKQHPIWADIKYFFWALFNIISGKIRSN